MGRCNPIEAERATNIADRLDLPNRWAMAKLVHGAARNPAPGRPHGRIGRAFRSVFSCRDNEATPRVSGRELLFASLLRTEMRPNKQEGPHSA